MLIGLEIRGLKEVVQNIQRGREAMHRENLKNMKKVVAYMEREIKVNRFSGPRGPDRLGVGQAARLVVTRTGTVGRQTAGAKGGRARASITGRVELRGNEAIGFVGTPVKYVGAHERGATIPARIIVPVRKRALAFVSHGSAVVVKWAHRPAFRLPARHMFENERKKQQPTVERFLGDTARTVTRVSNGEPA